MDFLNEIEYTALQDGENLMLVFTKCFLDCDVYKDGEKISVSKTEKPANSCVTASYSLEFDEYIDDYWMSCGSYPDFHYYYENTYVKEKAPKFNRFYYQMTVNENDNKLTVKLINELPAEICTFQWVGATSSSPTPFSSVCLNHGRCFYHPCDIITFSGVTSEIKAIRIRVIKLGMKPVLSYEDNIYIIKHGSDIAISDVRTNEVTINMTGKNNNVDGSVASGHPPISCTLTKWNINAPLISETARTPISSSTCSFGQFRLQLDSSDKIHDIEARISNIENYPNVMRHFLVKTTQTNELTVDNNGIIPTDTGFRLTPYSSSTDVKCVVYVKESESKQNYFPAICEEDKLCFETCSTQMTVIGLYANTEYDIKIVPNGGFNKKILKKRTGGDDYAFKWSGSTSKSSLVIKLTTDFSDAPTTDCYYQLTRHKDDKWSSTEVMATCVEGCQRNNKKCDDVRFDSKVYSKKFHYRLMVYIKSKSNRVKIDIPKLYQAGIIKQKLFTHVDGEIDKFTVSLSEFPDDNYKCLIKVSNFDLTKEFEIPTCQDNISGGSCIASCDDEDVKITYINSKITRYLSICWGYDEIDAKACREPTIFSIKMNYLQQHTYKVSHADQKAKISFKLNSATSWVTFSDNQPDRYTNVDNLNTNGYANVPQDKSHSFILDRYLDIYELESTLMWPSIIYYVNNSYLKKNILSKSRITYLIEKGTGPNELLIKFSPGSYNGEICHIKAFDVKGNSHDDESLILNNCGTEGNGCYQLCQNGKIILKESTSNKIVGISIRRRFDAGADHKQYYMDGETGVSLSGLTSNSITLNGLNIYNTIKKTTQASTCTINIAEAHLLLASQSNGAMCSGTKCNTQCDSTYTITGLNAGTNYVISVAVRSLVNGFNNYVKTLFFRTVGGDVMVKSDDTSETKYINHRLKPARNDGSLLVCRLYVKDLSEENGEYNGAICDETKICEGFCHEEFNVTNLNIGTGYSLRVEPSLGKKVVEETFTTSIDKLTMKYIYIGENGLRLIGHFNSNIEESNCHYVLYEEMHSDDHAPKYWCQDNKCSSEGCILDFNDLSYEKNYTIHVEAHGRSELTQLHIPYSKIENHKDIMKSKYDDINSMDVFDHFIKTDKTADDKPDSKNIGSLYTHILYGIIPIVATLVIILGVAIYKRNESSQALDI